LLIQFNADLFPINLVFHAVVYTHVFGLTAGVFEGIAWPHLEQARSGVFYFPPEQKKETFGFRIMNFFSKIRRP
jgi:hypothetical protein